MLLFYYYAFNVRHLVHWLLPPERAPPWNTIEQSVLPAISILQSLFVKLVGEVKKIWLKISHLCSFDPYLNACSNIWLNAKLCINKTPFFMERIYEEACCYIKRPLKKLKVLVHSFLSKHTLIVW